MSNSKYQISIVLTVWLMLGCCLQVRAVTLSQHDSWNSTSSYRTSYPSATTNSRMQSSSWGYTPAHNKISAYDSDFGQGVKLSSYFQSTSADALLSDYSGGSVHGGMRRSWGWGSPEDEDPIGVVPIGEPFVLLVMALLYVFCLLYRSRAKGSEMKTTVVND